MQYFGTGRLVANTAQSVAYTATPGIVAKGVSSGVQKLRIVVTSDAFVAMEGTPGPTNGFYLLAGQPEYFTVTQGQKPGAVQVSAGGTMYIAEVS